MCNSMNKSLIRFLTSRVNFPSLFKSYKSNTQPRRSSIDPCISKESVIKRSSNRIVPVLARSIFRKRKTE